MSPKRGIDLTSKFTDILIVIEVWDRNVTYHGLRKLYRVRVMSCLHLFCHCVNKVVPKETLILKLAAMKHFLSICVHGGTQTSRSQNYGHTHTHMLSAVHTT